MPNPGQGGASIIDTSGISAAVVAPTPTQLVQISQSCISRALSGLTPQQKKGLQSAITAVKSDLATAIDLVRQRRARMSNQLRVLQNQANDIQGGASNIAALYTYAEPAVISCQTAQTAILQAKIGSDLVHARLNEIQYQMSLINTTDLILASQQQELSSANDALDQMLLSLG